MTTKINGRTPEEIKKGIEYCISESVLSCDECPYAGKPCDSMQMLKDALAYIQQLERERDAAVEELRKFNCASCIHEELQTEEEPCVHCNWNWGSKISKDLRENHWQWRGVQEVNNDAEERA